VLYSVHSSSNYWHLLHIVWRCKTDRFWGQQLLFIGKVFAHVLPSRIQPLIDMTHKPQQSGFVAGRSTVDAILALHLLSDIHHEFGHPLNVEYLDIKAAFDSVDCRTPWKALHGRDVTDIILDLIAALHDNTVAQIRAGKKLCDRCEMTSGGETRLCPCSSIVLHCDWLGPKPHAYIEPEINIGSCQFTDLVYANDTAFFIQSALGTADWLSSFNESPSVIGMHVSWPKTKLQNLGSGDQLPSISMPKEMQLNQWIISYISALCSHLMDTVNQT